jgi:hypothetical protein
MKIDNVQKRVLKKKHPYFWAKNERSRVIRLKTRAKKCKNEHENTKKRAN